MGGCLISGAGGFVGRALATHLRASGRRVATVGLRTEPAGARDGPTGSPVQQWVRALDRYRPEVVFHLAGAMQGDEAFLRAVNVGLTEALVEALRLTGLRPVLIVAGSAAEYGAAVLDGIPVREDAACSPGTPYGRSKLAQTRAALAFRGEERSRVLVARIFNPIGPGMPGHLALADFARQIARMPSSGGTLVTGNLDVRRDFLHIDDLAAALASLAGHDAADGIWNVCSGVPTRLRDLLDSMIAASGKDVRISPDLNRYRQDELETIVGDTARISTLTGGLWRRDLRDAAIRLQSVLDDSRLPPPHGAASPSRALKPGVGSR
ncbi:MAG: NAD-dependent epimerase/dehydratase family protein [Methylobacterium frigidaeris]